MANQASAGMACFYLSLHHPGAGIIQLRAKLSSHLRINRSLFVESPCIALAFSSGTFTTLELWGNATACPRPSLLDDSYGSKTGLYPPRRT